MNQFSKSMLVVIITLVLEFLISMLFDWSFVEGHSSRKILVWIIMFVVIFIGFRLIQAINKIQETNSRNQN